ncbi:hypothetical protein [Candidatus Enterovibrio escicola]|uniref:Uncharacterized protein n=1 Tax=Candidatus Enterovibrio escicola TaxID=1927127 RepID=A0A2A5T2B0_9GAMM|nr:hypothetical protein [Candidatus Enterovibrio escacola]PCS22284.1 hypothetical protein BTN49_2013 [Candidatus Enterovibrio escacola]
MGKGKAKHLCRSEVDYNAPVSKALVNMKVMNKVIRLYILVR